MTSFPTLNPPIRTLLGPGPSELLAEQGHKFDHGASIAASTARYSEKS